MNTKTNTDRTAETLFEMFTENTGRHFLDSGGAYGRNWERAQGLTLENFLSAPSANWERNWGVTTNAFTYCLSRLTYSKTAEVLTRLLNVWELKDFDNRNPWSLGDQEEFLEGLGAENLNGFNTYNWENSLSQVLQGYTFELFGGQHFTLLQVHGGADVRGGYTRPKIFEAHCGYWLHGTEDVGLECHGCEIVGYCYDSSAPGEWRRYGELPAPLFGEPERYLLAPENYDYVNGCPECGGDLVATNESECY